MRKLRITIGNKSYDVTVEDLTAADSYQTSSLPVQSAAPPSASVQPAPRSAPPSFAGGAVISPMAGVIKSVLVKPADQVKSGQPLIVLEAMKMENQITAHIAGTVTEVHVKEGDSVREGHVLVELQ